MALKKLGAEVVRADLTIPSDVDAALQGCWGVFGVTNFYDSVCSLPPGFLDRTDLRVEDPKRPSQ